MVYAGKDMLSDVLADRLKQGYGVWLANWTVQTRYNGDTSSGSTPAQVSLKV